MARKLRENLAGGMYHVYSRGIAKRSIFEDDVDRRSYLSLLRQVTDEKRWACLAYCLMGNHVHLLIETPDANLSSGMQVLNGRYAQRFNARHGRTGHVFEGRYGAVRIASDAQLHAVAEYIARNPVEAGFCAQPEDYVWSGRSLRLANLKGV